MCFESVFYVWTLPSNEFSRLLFSNGYNIKCMYNVRTLTWARRSLSNGWVSSNSGEGDVVHSVS